jgi:hypothetical protein
MSRSSEYPKLLQIISQYMVRDMSVCPWGTLGWVGIDDGYFSRLIIAHPILTQKNTANIMTTFIDNQSRKCLQKLLNMPSRRLWFKDQVV